MQTSDTNNHKKLTLYLLSGAAAGYAVYYFTKKFILKRKEVKNAKSDQEATEIEMNDLSNVFPKSDEYINKIEIAREFIKENPDNIVSVKFATIILEIVAELYKEKYKLYNARMRKERRKLIEDSNEYFSYVSLQKSESENMWAATIEEAIVNDLSLSVSKYNEILETASQLDLEFSKYLLFIYGSANIVTEVQKKQEITPQQIIKYFQAQIDEVENNKVPSFANQDQEVASICRPLYLSDRAFLSTGIEEEEVVSNPALKENDEIRRKHEELMKAIKVANLM